MMVHRPTFTTVHSAKAYLVNRIAEQAIREGTPLSDAEVKLLYYSEDEKTVGNEVVDDFPDDNSEYESKITAFLQRRYRRECGLANGGEAQSFVEAVEVLQSGDHYILVMAEPALTSFVPRMPLLTPVSWKQGILVVIVLAVLVVFGAWVMGNLLQ